MYVYLNNEKKSVPDETSLQEFFDQNQVVLGCGAIMINRSFVPRSMYAGRLLKENDRIELIIPMQGG